VAPCNLGRAAVTKSLTFMKKKLCLWLGGGGVLLLALAYLVLIFFCGSIVKSRINTFGPELTQTTVVLGGAQLSPLSGTGTLTDLVVGNPKGWSAPDAFTLKSIHIDLVPSSVFSDHIVINEIVIDDPELVYETKLVSSNIGDLIKAIDKSKNRKPADGPTAQNGKPTTFVIRKLRLEHGHVRLGVGPTAVTLDLPTTEFTNLGSDGGVSAEQLSLLIMRTIASDVVKGSIGGIGKGVSGIGSVAGLALKGSFEVLDTLLGGIGK
jgi:hypothetical protein